MDQIQYLEDERKKIWQEILDLKEQLAKRTPDYESDARQSSKKASEYRNKIEASKNEALSALEKIRQGHREVAEISNMMRESVSHVEQSRHTIAKHLNEVEAMHQDYEGELERFSSTLVKLDELHQRNSELIEKANNLAEIYVQGNDYAAKLEAVYKSLIAKKKEIDVLYIEIFGYSEKDQKTGDDVIVEGLKTKLEQSYDVLQKSIVVCESDLKMMKDETDKKMNIFLNEQNSKVGNSFNSWTNQISAIQEKISSLLPDALTAGLSHDYSKKTKDEMKSSLRLSITFYIAIVALVAVSLIPFGVSLYLFLRGIPLVDAVYKMPRLVLSILPLYVPVLWVAYSASKKLNLSKRLIEEYTHKEVLSKTFEGLSRQIRDLDDREISEELKTKLLFNILEVSSENPGKLISDYNKTDHPLMDALDKSIKLTNAVDRLGRIPGFVKIAEILSEKAKNILVSEAKKAEVSLQSLNNDADSE